RNILALVAAGLLIVAGLGWYLGWYHVKATPTGDGHEQISIDVDKKKVVADIKKGVQEGTHQVEGILKKDGVSPSTPTEIRPLDPLHGTQRSWRYGSDGTPEYTGEISTPVPIAPSTK